MDWGNIDLKSEYEKDQPILDSYSTNQLLLEIYTNIRTENITESSIRDHFKNVLNNNIISAEEIFELNIKNIVKYAKKERKDERTK